MEKKVREEIDRLTAAVCEAESEVNTRWSSLQSEIFTKDIMRMVKTIAQNQGVTALRFCLTNNEQLWVYGDEVVFKIKNTHSFNDITELFVKYPLSPIPNYSEYQIRNLREHAESVQLKNKYLDIIQTMAEDIIKTITENYRETTEAQLHSLAKISDMINVPHEEVKHIKVTVEWV